MSQRRTQNSDSVQLRQNTQALMIGGGILVACMVFGLAFAVGRCSTSRLRPTPAGRAGPAGWRRPRAAPGPQPVGPAAATAAIGRQGVGHAGASARVAGPSGQRTAIGDNPRLAIPELKPTG